MVAANFVRPTVSGFGCSKHHAPMDRLVSPRRLTGSATLFREDLASKLIPTLQDHRISVQAVGARQGRVDGKTATPALNETSTTMESADLGPRSVHNASAARQGYRVRPRARVTSFVGLTLKRVVPTRPITLRAVYAAAPAGQHASESVPSRCYMQEVIKRGRRLFAVPKALSLTDRIANKTQCRGNWNRLPSTGTTARVVRNYK